MSSLARERKAAGAWSSVLTVPGSGTNWRVFRSAGDTGDRWLQAALRSDRTGTGQQNNGFVEGFFWSLVVVPMSLV